MFGKFSNRAFGVVKRPKGHVLKSRWVFTIKYTTTVASKL